MIPLPSKPKITEQSENKALFEMDSLYPGYGVTIGNSMRRVLLSSLSGAAVTKVKIEGAEHEFSVIDGVMEDVITIIQNLKKLRFKVYSEEPQTVTLDVKGEKEAKGSDLKVPSQLEVVSPDAHIAALTSSKSSLFMEMEVSTGVGYSPLEERKEEKLDIGQILVDAIFTPVRKVNFHVENMRVGKRTDFDRLFVELETDGTVSPQEAFSSAAEILVSHFSLLMEGKEDSLPQEEKAEEKKEDDPKDLKVEDLDISDRIKKTLKENKVSSVRGILKKGDEGLLKIKGMGEKAIQEINEELKKKGL